MFLSGCGSRHPCPSDVILCIPQMNVWLCFSEQMTLFSVGEIHMSNPGQRGEAQLCACLWIIMWAWQTEYGKVWQMGNYRLTVLCEVHVQEWLCLIILLMYAAKHCIHNVGRIQVYWNLIMYIASVNQNVITCSHLSINKWIRLYEKYILL